MKSAPMKSAPMKSAPMKSAPMKSAPMKSAPMQQEVLPPPQIQMKSAPMKMKSAPPRQKAAPMVQKRVQKKKMMRKKREPMSGPRPPPVRLDEEEKKRAANIYDEDHLVPIRRPPSPVESTFKTKDAYNEAVEAHKRQVDEINELLSFVPIDKTRREIFDRVKLFLTTGAETPYMKKTVTVLDTSRMKTPIAKTKHLHVVPRNIANALLHRALTVEDPQQAASLLDRACAVSIMSYCIRVCSC